MATQSKGPVWGDHTQGGSVFCLRHLHPIFKNHEIPAQPSKGGKPGRALLSTQLYIHYSHHCFTQALEKLPEADPDLFYTCTTRRETRVFCQARWSESKLLPAIIAAIDRGKCFHTRHHNYFVVRDPSNPALGDYFIYFAVVLSKSGFVDVHIESAYPRLDAERQLKNAERVGFNVLVVNALRMVDTRRPSR